MKSRICFWLLTKVDFTGRLRFMLPAIWRGAFPKETPK